jgi:hypothetical protein
MQSPARTPTRSSRSCVGLAVTFPGCCRGEQVPLPCHFRVLFGCAPCILFPRLASGSHAAALDQVEQDGILWRLWGKSTGCARAHDEWDDLLAWEQFLARRLAVSGQWRGSLRPQRYGKCCGAEWAPAATEIPLAAQW